MADSPLPRPKMDWCASDKAQALQNFRQLCDMWFAVKGTAKELQHNYIMLWLGTEGLRLLNTWNLTVEQLKRTQRTSGKNLLLYNHFRTGDTSLEL